MTKTEQAELEELGLTPEALKAKQQALASVTAPQPNGRKRRSDAGTKRELRPKPQAAGVLTAEQAEKLTRLHSKLISAKWAYDSVQSEWFAYLDELQGKH